MPVIKSSTPVLDAGGSPATRRVVYAYRTDTGALVGRGMTSDGAGDPHWNNVEILLLARGDNNSANFIDWSPRPKTIVPSGDVKFTTAQALDESVSAVFDGNNDVLTVVDAALAPGTGDFTLEGFIQRLGTTVSSVNHDITLWEMRKASATNDPLVYIQGNDDDNEVVYFAGSDRITGSSIVVGTPYHLELSRVSGVSRLFLNGVQQGSSYTDSGNYAGDQILIGGRYAAISGSLRSYNGYHGSFRYTKGVGRHSAGFTPPTSFPVFDDTLPAGHYLIDTGTYEGECHVVCLDDAAGAIYNHKILRTVPV